MFYPVFGVVTRVHGNMQNKELRNLFFSPYIIIILSLIFEDYLIIMNLKNTIFISHTIIYYE